MDPVEVLWVDDDISSTAKKLTKKLGTAAKGIVLFTAKSCEEADVILNSRSTPPDWAIVDLVVRQGKWGSKYHQVPGIEYIKDLKARYGDKINVVAFSIMVDRDIEDQVKQAGAHSALVKSNVSFVQILERIRNNATFE